MGVGALHDADSRVGQEASPEQPDATWPVLCLLHGATDDHATWAEQTDVVDLTAGLDLLVVMPHPGTDHGTHAWPYSEQGLHHALPLLLEAIEE